MLPHNVSTADASSARKIDGALMYRILLHEWELPYYGFLSAQSLFRYKTESSKGLPSPPFKHMKLTYTATKQVESASTGL